MFLTADTGISADPTCQSRVHKNCFCVFFGALFAALALRAVTGCNYLVAAAARRMIGEKERNGKGWLQAGLLEISGETLSFNIFGIQPRRMIPL